MQYVICLYCFNPYPSSKVQFRAAPDTAFGYEYTKNKMISLPLLHGANTDITGKNRIVAAVAFLNQQCT